MRRSAIIPAILILAGCGAPVTSAAHAARTAPGTYEAGVCTKPGPNPYVVVNVGGRNQNGEFVHTPNLRPTGHARLCAIQPGWWFQPDQTLEINARAANGEWQRLFRDFSRCRPAGARRWCDI